MAGRAAGVHPSALIDPQARLAADVQVGPFCVIGPKVEIVREMRGIWKYTGRAEVDGALAAEAELMATLRDKA